MAITIDREARAAAADEIRRVVAEPSAEALDKASSSAKTRDKAVRAVLKRASSVVKRAALLSPEGQERLFLTDEEKKQLDYYVLFLESGREMAGMSTSLQNRDLVIALAAYFVLFAAFGGGLWLITHDFWGSVYAGSVFSAFIYSIGLLIVMISSTAKSTRKALVQLRPLGVRFLWPFASLSDLSETLESKASAKAELSGSREG